MPTPLQHELVTASAGFGKTHRLVSRLLALLTHPGNPAAPETVAALTFSRAAAGEIMDTLVYRLARAARNEEGAATEREINSELTAQLPVAAYRQALQRLLSQMHSSFIGTIDSFFLRILQAFGPDLGVPGELSMLDEHSMAQRREELLRQLLAADSTPGAARTTLGEAYKQASYGQETKNVTQTISEMTERWHALFLRAPQAELWGDPRRIWGGDSPWLNRQPPPVSESAAALRASLAEEELSAAQWGKWEELITAAQAFTPTTRTSISQAQLFGKLLDVLPDLAAGRAQITNYKKTDLSAATCRQALNLLWHILYCELRNRLRATRGSYELLHRYETLYHKTLRQHGMLTFQDVPCLLTGRALQALDDWDPSRPAPDMMYVNYRLDGQLDHWALDEFQDTSRDQWAILHDLLGEVLHATPPQRSFFAVGDVKQAIYGWRGGDVRLMGELRERYAQGANAPLRTSQLPRSFRSCQAVLDLVNATFGQPETWPAGVPESARRRWADPDVWCQHQAAQNKRGFATVVQLEKPPKGSAADDPCRQATAAILRQLDAAKRGLSVAVLVRSNQEGNDSTQYLREQGIDARWDGEALIADNPVVAALMASLRAAAHPGDTLAARHREMTPLSPADKRQPGTEELLRIVAEKGFEAAIERLVTPLRRDGILDAFAEFRLGQLTEAARTFDAGGSTDLLDFEAYVLSFTVRDLPPSAGVRVMTLHRSKGLGFDAVILPDLDSARIDDFRSDGLTVVTDPQEPGQIRWLMDLPTRSICEADPVLAEHRRHLVEQNAFETLCLLYVGMTRAKQGLYMLSLEPGKSSKTLTMGSFLQEIHGAGEGGIMDLPGMPSHCVHAAVGDPNWCAAVAQQATSVTEERSAGPPPLQTARSRPIPLHRRRLPSASAEERPAATLFAPQSRRATGFGTLIHALFEEISWLDAEGLDASVSRWRERQSQMPAELLDAAEASVRDCLAEPEVAAAFSRPAVAADLRREQSFELLLEERWVSGVFDRLVLYAAPTGPEGTRAEILDFKSDRVSDPGGLAAAVESHRPQLELYRQALASIGAIPAAAIRVRLLFTGPRRLVSI